MNFIYQRRIYFSETDAAGVVYFANFLSFCHEAYEEALRSSNIELQQLFENRQIVIPILHAECDYLRPLKCGDKIEIEITSEIKNAESFSLHYELFRLSPRKRSARAKTEHLCIDPKSRKRKPLPPNFHQFLSQFQKT